MVRIALLDQRDFAVASQIHAVMLLAHAQEAVLLQRIGSAPMAGTALEVQAGQEFHLGAFCDEKLVGSVSLGPDDEAGQISVANLVVHPQHQRQGIARALMLEALRRGEGAVFSVSAVAANGPALALYRGLGFVVYREGVMGADEQPVVKLRRPRAGCD